jgi:hypothetical protein
MEAARMNWGCDAPARIEIEPGKFQPVEVFSVTCAACVEGDPDCSECKGSGLVPFDRCPTAFIRENYGPADTRRVESLLRCYVQYSTRNALPAEGGYADQTAYFASSVDIIDAERGRYEGMVKEKREREAKAAEKKAQQGRRAR